ncbi:MAG: NAD(P)/FAD-dependent oxidoreductase [Zhaonellaceae bacterium]|nr:NAD(P)/FAD-dependent oxidoreductase [Clostridia bacterium]
MNQVLIVGGGAAGIFAALSAAHQGAKVTLLEKNSRLGVKLLITGKGRCNLTNIGNIESLIANFPTNGVFLYSAFYQFSNEDLLELLKGLKVETKIERGGRVFPVSDKAKDVVNALVNYLKMLKVNIQLNTVVKGLKIENNKIVGVFIDQSKLVKADAVIVCTGGLSYPRTGSTGDGFNWAKSAGHVVTRLFPSLVPLEVQEQWVKDLSGLTLKNVKVTVYQKDEKIAEKFGEMLFTHFGVSGPIILSLSRWIVPLLSGNKKIKLEIDLKPALNLEKLDERVKRDFQKYANRQLKNSLHDLLPKALILPIIKLSNIPIDKQCNQITKAERLNIVELLKHLPVTIVKPRSFDEAIVTSGGVNVKEINPSTMESKLIKGLYFAGEVIDIDAYTGGYNLQAAFSTGYVAGQAAALQVAHNK